MTGSGGSSKLIEVLKNSDATSLFQIWHCFLRFSFLSQSGKTLGVEDGVKRTASLAQQSETHSCADTSISIHFLITHINCVFY